MVGSFDLAYASTPSMFYGYQPAFQLQDMLKRHNLSNGKALDVGCGDGRNAVFLAYCGYHVIAIDESSVALDKLRVTTKTHNLNIEIIRQDIRSFNYPIHFYDLIVAHTVIDHIIREEGNLLVETLKNSLAPNGVIYLSVFTTDDPGATGTESGSDTIQFVKRFFAPNELLKLFDDMELLEYREERFLSTSHGSPHYHALATILSKIN